MMRKQPLLATLAVAVAAPLFAQPLAAADVTAYLEAVDRNGDQFVTADELSAAPALARNFSVADENGDGALDAKEFEALLRLPMQEQTNPQ